MSTVPIFIYVLVYLALGIIGKVEVVGKSVRCLKGESKPTPEAISQECAEDHVCYSHLSEDLSTYSRGCTPIKGAEGFCKENAKKCCLVCDANLCNYDVLCSTDPTIQDVKLDAATGSKVLVLPYDTVSMVKFMIKVKIDKPPGTKGATIPRLKESNMFANFKVRYFLSDICNPGVSTISTPTKDVILKQSVEELKIGSEVTLESPTTQMTDVLVPQAMCSKITCMQVQLHRGDTGSSADSYKGAQWIDDDPGDNFFTVDIRHLLMCAPDLKISEIKIDPSVRFKSGTSVSGVQVRILNKKPADTIGTPISKATGNDINFLLRYSFSDASVESACSAALSAPTTVDPNRIAKRQDALAANESLLLDVSSLDVAGLIPADSAACRQRKTLVFQVRHGGGPSAEVEVNNNCLAKDISSQIVCSADLQLDVNLINAAASTPIFRQDKLTPINLKFTIQHNGKTNQIPVLTGSYRNIKIGYTFSTSTAHTCPAGATFQPITEPSIAAQTLQLANWPNNQDTPYEFTVGFNVTAMSASDCRTTKGVVFKLEPSEKALYEDTNGDNDCKALDISAFRQCTTDIELKVTKLNPTTLPTFRHDETVSLDLEFNVTNIKAADIGGEIRPVKNTDYDIQVYYALSKSCTNPTDTLHDLVNIPTTMEPNPVVTEDNNISYNETVRFKLDAPFNLRVSDSQCEQVKCLQLIAKNGSKATFLDDSWPNNYHFENLTDKLRCKADPKIKIVKLKNTTLRQDTENSMNVEVEIMNDKGEGTTGTAIPAATGTNRNFEVEYVLSNETECRKGPLKMKLWDGNHPTTKPMNLTNIPEAMLKKRLGPWENATLVASGSKMNLTREQCLKAKYIHFTLRKGNGADFIDSDIDNNCFVLDITPYLQCSPGVCHVGDSNTPSPLHSPTLVSKPCDFNNRTCVAVKDERSKRFSCEDEGFCKFNKSSSRCCCVECYTADCNKDKCMTPLVCIHDNGGQRLTGTNMAAMMLLMTCVVLAMF